MQGWMFLYMFCLILKELGKKTKQEQFSRNEDWGKLLIQGSMERKLRFMLLLQIMLPR